MQPQGPANPQGGPYPPYGPPSGPQPGSAPYQPGSPYQAPGQQYLPPQPLQPGQMGAPQPAIPGAQTPQYQAPKSVAKGPNGEPLAAPPDAAETPYDFFMSQPKPATPLNPLPVGGKHLGNIPTDFNKAGKDTSNPLKGKLPLIVGGGLALVVILLGISFLTPKDETGPRLFNIAQIQQEVVRVCTQGTTKAKYRSTRYFAITCSTGVTTDQKNLLAYMQKQNLAFNAKALGGKANGTTDSKLKSAQSSSSYDDTFRELAGAQLEAYDKALTLQLGITTGENARELLTKSQTSNQLLIKMVQDDSDKTEAPASSDSEE